MRGAIGAAVITGGAVGVEVGAKYFGALGTGVGSKSVGTVGVGVGSKFVDDVGEGVVIIDIERSCCSKRSKYNSSLAI